MAAHVARPTVIVTDVVDWNFRSLAAALVGYVIILGTAGAVWAMYGGKRRRRLLFVVIPAVLWALFAGIPFVVAPVVSLGRLATAVGILCVMAGAAFATVAARARKALQSAAHRSVISTSDAMSRLDGGGSAEVTLQGSIEADPPLMTPMGAVPCLSYRLELFRHNNGTDELIGLEEVSCDRVVIADHSGRVVLSTDPRGLSAAGAPVTETVATGSLGTPTEDSRLRRAVRQLEPKGPMPGATYRAVEHFIQHGAPMTAVGRMVRRAGEPVLVPTLAARVSVRFGGDATQGYRRLMVTCAALSALSVGAGLALVSSPKEIPPEQSSDSQTP